MPPPGEIMVAEHILVVGGAEPDATILRNALKEHELFMIAGTWKETQKFLESRSGISIVIINMGGSREQGIQILRKLNSHPEYADIYTILITNRDEPDTDYLALNSGADDTIHTPLETFQVQELVLFYQTHEWHKGLKWKLREKELMLNALLWRSPIGIAISQGRASIGKEGENEFIVNTMFERITGRTREEIQEIGWVKITHPDDLKEELDNYSRLLSGEIDSYEMEKRYIRPDGSTVWVLMAIASIYLNGIEGSHFVCLIQDISKRKAAEEALSESERSKSVLLANLPGMAYRCSNDREWTMQYVSQGCQELTGYAPEDLVLNRVLSFNDLILPEYRDILWREWEHVLFNHLPFKWEYEIVTRDHGKRWVIEIGQGIYSETGEVEALEGIILDITERKQFESSLQYYNDHDIWTGLYNHRYFERFLKHELATRTSKNRALISVNVSSIYTLSRRYGFQYSQLSVQRVAQSLKDLCTDGIEVFSAYESQFAFYVREHGTREELLPFLRNIYDRLDSILSLERIGWGIGIVEIDSKKDLSVEQILRNLLVSSEKSLDSFHEAFEFCYFDEALTVQIDREEEITRQLYEIASGENTDRLYLEFQAIYHLKSNTINGFEALARLDSPHLGVIQPLEFIPITEKTKLIIPLGEMIFRKACLFLKTLVSQGFPWVRISVNISPIQILNRGFTERILEIIKETGVSPSQIGLEITESVVASSFNEVNQVLGELKRRGIYIALDDFGTGYSSLSRERDLNVTCIKIDKSFIDRLLTLKPESAITGDIVSMAHKLGHCTVAEGVELEMQMEYLAKVGCDMIQGYYISRPLKPDDAYTLLKKNLPERLG